MPRDIRADLFCENKILGLRIVYGYGGEPVIPEQKDFAVAYIISVGVISVDAQKREGYAGPAALTALFYIIAYIFVCLFDEAVYIVMYIIFCFGFQMAVEPCEHVGRGIRCGLALVKIYIGICRAFYIFADPVENGVKMYVPLGVIAVYPPARRVIGVDIQPVHIKIVFVYIFFPGV